MDAFIFIFHNILGEFINTNQANLSILDTPTEQSINTGGVKTTPIAAMEIYTNTPALQARKRVRAMIKI
jgi:hypothetical protein